MQHSYVKTLLSELPEPYKSLSMTNAKVENNLNHYVYNLPSTALNTIPWDRTFQGHSFWSKIYLYQRRRENDTRRNIF